MLWVNLIMDILGAIAIGTEPYMKNVSKGFKSQRVSRRDVFILPHMWRQIIGHTVYQLFVMMFLMYFGQYIFFDRSFNLIYEPKRDVDTGEATNRLVLDTICFHTFILMNMFNQITCRIISPDDLNIFSTLFNNLTFWVVFAIEIAI